MALIPTNAINIQRSAAVTTPLVARQNGTYAPPSGVDGFNPVTVDVQAAPTLQDKTATPTTSQQEITADAGYDGLRKVTVNAMPPGTEGTPTAIKGGVHNHAMQVTPKVTNQAGYIPGTTKTGTPVSVSAAELVSGTKRVTQNGTEDVTNYASVEVDVQAQPDLQDKTATPDTDDTVVTADAGYDGLRQVTVEGDANFIPENIAAGVTIWGKTGTHAGGGGGSTFSTFENGIETIYAYLTFTQSGGTVAFTTPAMQDKTVTPNTTQQVVTADAGYVGLHQVTVDGDADLVAGNIKSGVTIFGVTGTYAGAAALFSAFQGGIETEYAYLAYELSGGTAAFTTTRIKERA